MNPITAPAVKQERYTETLDGAVESALWSTIPTIAEDDDSMIEPAGQYEITDEEKMKLRGTLAFYIKDWFNENYDLLVEAVETVLIDWESVGHDFWLTSQGHGAGFWDRGLGELGDKLTDSCGGHSDIVSFYLTEDYTHVLVETHNITDFTGNLTL